MLDLIAAIRRDEALREELRSVLLSQELLSLPERFSAFVAEMHDFVAEMQDFVAEMHDFVAAVNAHFERLEGDVSQLRGGYFENLVRVHGAAYLGGIGLRRARFIAHDQLVEACYDAVDEGRITDGEARDALLADAVFSAHRDGDAVCAVCEVASWVHRDDVQRAVRRSTIVSTVLGVPGVPVVMGASIDDPAGAMAADADVAVITPTEWAKAA